MDTQEQNPISDSQLVDALNSYENMNVDNHNDSLTNSQLVEAVRSYESKFSIDFYLHYF